MFWVVVPNISAICAWVSQTVSPSNRTSIFAAPFSSR
jgi:hypothetical protein